MFAVFVAMGSSNKGPLPERTLIIVDGFGVDFSLGSHFFSSRTHPSQAPKTFLRYWP